MKILILISGLFLLFSCENKNEKKISENRIAEDSLSSNIKLDSITSKKNLSSIEGIRAEYNLVASKLTAKKLDSVSFNYECEEISGNVVYYSEKGKLKVVKHFQADSHFSSTEQYFVNNGKPYFIFKDDTVWSFDGGTSEKPETKDEVTEQRFYIVNGKAIQCLEKKYTLKSNSTKNPKSDNVPNKEMKNCSITELQKSFELLMKHQGQKGIIKCL